MRFLITNIDYPEFLRWLYAENPGLEHESYETQARVRAESFFGEADFYSSNLRKLGHEAWEVHANNEHKQKAWAREHGLRLNETGMRGIVQKTRDKINRMPLAFMRPLLQPMLGVPGNQPGWLYQILAAQIEFYKPDVIYNQSIEGVSAWFLRKMKKRKDPRPRFLLGQHAATRLRPNPLLREYDLVVSSFPPTLEDLRGRGIRAELLRLGFEPRVLDALKDNGRPHDVTFVGSFYSVHGSRTAMIELLCARFPQMKIFGPATESLPANSAIRKCYAGQAWGRGMYQALRDSKIVFNHHGDVPPYANNYRLYEATGVGALLVTDWKENLHEMFEPGREVVAYRSDEECAEQIDYYLRNSTEREEIARLGQERTLREHTFANRMRELVELIQRYY